MSVLSLAKLIELSVFYFCVGTQETRTSAAVTSFKNTGVLQADDVLVMDCFDPDFGPDSSCHRGDCAIFRRSCLTVISAEQCGTSAQ